MYRKILKSILLVGCALAITFLPFKNALAASFNSSNLISNSYFVGYNAMSASDIQNFLNDKGSCLKNYSQNGRSAARIIYDAAHGYGDASGTWNGIVINSSTGTIHPGAILTTLQKEQSLISDSSRCTDSVLNKAMGYGCPDSGGCSSTYAGFTKQVENAAWQLRYNYERAYGHGFGDYQVGQSFCFDDWNGTHCGKYDNQATAALYRYTPHVYNGNYNFWNLFYNTYRFQVPALNSKYITQSPWNNRYNVNFAGYAGQSTTMTVSLYNTGTSTWSTNSSNPVLLGVPGDRNGFGLVGSSSFGRNRAAYPNSVAVAPNDRAVFTFRVAIPSWAKAGTYTQELQLVKEGVAWFGPKFYYTVKVLEKNKPAPVTYSQNASFVSQSPWNSVHNVNVAGGNGYSTYVTVRLKNTGNTTWERNSSNPVLLGVVGDVNGFGLVGSNSFGRNRAAYPSSASVAPGETTNFTFRVAIPSWAQPGLYYTKLQLVKEGVQWFGPEVVVSYRVHPR